MASKNVRLLIVDDSSFMRKVISDLLKEVPFIDIVGEAKDGKEALKKARKLKPAVITMDYKMPELNGLEATKLIMETKDYSPGIIIFSAYTEDGIREAFRGLRMGAIDFIAKPDGEFSPDLDTVKQELIDKIKIAANAYFHTITKDLDTSLRPRIQKKLSKKPELIILGASTGGPPVLEKILKGIDPGIKTPILVVQHMPQKFTSVFAELVNKGAKINIKQAEEGEEIIAGNCYIAPSGSHMKVEVFDDLGSGIKNIVHLSKESKVSGYRPSIDVLMESAVSSYHDKVLGIILTGMGSDGLKGSLKIHENGGHIIAQSLQSAVIESMPSSVINAGICDEILSPQEITNIINSSCS